MLLVFSITVLVGNYRAGDYFTAYSLPCTEEVPTCLETCDRVLNCGIHLCTQRCHTGPCGMVYISIYYAFAIAVFLSIIVFKSITVFLLIAVFL